MSEYYSKRYAYNLPRVSALKFLNASECRKSSKIPENPRYIFLLSPRVYLFFSCKNVRESVRGIIFQVEEEKLLRRFLSVLPSKNILVLLAISSSYLSQPDQWISFPRFVRTGRSHCSNFNFRPCVFRLDTSTNR